MTEKRDEWGVPKMICPLCNGYIYENDSTHQTGDSIVHKECYDVRKRLEEATRGLHDDSNL